MQVRVKHQARSTLWTAVMPTEALNHLIVEVLLANRMKLHYANGDD
ncbi:MAG: hypothetical protein KJ060_09920 [Candidatus Hydrogenedentes bacterium]|nr:hypothetical protein [Candidatus Hydrogenedentota bacterium]